MIMTLSIVMPVYNEAPTLERALRRALDAEYPCPVEVIVVDDGSSDGTPAILDELHGTAATRLIRLRHRQNQGKGAAVRTGVDAARGSHMIVMDADLEYDPADIAGLLGPVLRGHADHVFGSRVFGVNTSFRSFRFAVGGRLTTFVTNIMYDSCVTDMHTCLKLLPVAHFRALRLDENGFGLDTEMTVRLLRAGVRPFEVPVSYIARSVAQGKKISWEDGLRCLFIAARVRVERNPQTLPPVISESAALRLARWDEGHLDGPETATPHIDLHTVSSIRLEVPIALRVDDGDAEAVDATVAG